MTELCLKPDIVLSMLDEIGKHRALEPHETDLIEDILAIESKPFRWNPRLENQLLTAATSQGGITRFAARHGIDRFSAYQKLHRLRRRKNRKTDKRGIEG